MVGALRFDKLRITNVGGLDKLDLSFSPSLNVICGSNGIGKTTILESLVSFFSFYPAVSRRINSPSGSLHLSFYMDGSHREHSFIIQQPSPFQPDNASLQLSGLSSLVLFLRSNRDILYQQLSYISRDPPRDEGLVASTLPAGIDSNDIKNWLANRFLFDSHPNSLSLEQRENFILLKDSVPLIDKGVQFSHISADTFDIYVTTSDATILLEQLSSGYRSIFFMIFGIIKEIEFRRLGYARDFSGVVLIDEVDLHLHPSWQMRILDILRSVFPRAQFIVTTHSPHVVQAAKPGEVIALARSGTSPPALRALSETPEGFRGWSVEEILEDVMGMESTRSPDYDSAVKAFQTALLEENASAALSALRMLGRLLHPESSARKLFRLQAAGLLGHADISGAI